MSGRETWAEAALGLGVVVAAGLFLAFAASRTGPAASGSYELSARFPNATGIAAGTEVRVSGMTVGRVEATRLDPATYEAVVRLAIDPALRLPADSSAAITQESLLGGSYVALIPGGDRAVLAPGDEITDTQGATDLMALVGQVVNRSGDAPPPAASAPAEPGK